MTTSELPSDHPHDDAPAEPAPRRSRSRLARFGLIGVALAVVFFVLPRLPHDHAVTYRLGDASVTAVDVSWSRLDGDEGEAVRGATYHFDSGRAPTSIDEHVSLPNGRYELSVHVSDATGSRSFQRAITLDDAGPITIPLR